MDQVNAPAPPRGVIERFLAVGAQRATDRHDGLLWQALARSTAGGKRFRPRLLLETHAALGGSVPGVAAAVAEAVELLHTALVIHDDVIDGDNVRRGQPNVPGTFEALAAQGGVGEEAARNYGRTAGILAGDLALAGAVRAVALSGAGAGEVRRLLDLVEEVLHVTAAGELADVRVALAGHASILEAVEVAQWKTAAYSFQLPLQAGAILAGAPEQTVATLGEVGRLLGIAFQLRDDIAGVFGDFETTGKDPLSDLRAGKTTALIAHARSTTAWPALAGLVGCRELDEEGAQRARGLLVECGSLAAVEVLVEDLHHTAARIAELLPAEVCKMVTELMALTGRDRSAA